MDSNSLERYWYDLFTKVNIKEANTAKLTFKITRDTNLRAAQVLPMVRAMKRAANK